MMKFDGKTHKVEISSLTADEAKVFVNFLEGEKIRHEENIWSAERDITYYSQRGNETMIEFDKSAILRHQEDIEQIDILLETTKHWFELEEK